MTGLAHMTVATLISSGFNEQDFIAIQRHIKDIGATLKIVSTNQGLVNGWNGTGWGHNYPVDAQLNTALGVDYDALILIGGTGSMDKLKMTAHSRRFISSFMSAQKPVIAIGDALDMLAHANVIEGRRVMGSTSIKSACEAAGAMWSQDNPCVDSHLLTAETVEMIGETLQDILGISADLAQAA